MSDRRIDTFFYGLFMDIDILREGGVAPINPRRAYVEDLALRIGRRATLVPSAGLAPTVCCLPSPTQNWRFEPQAGIPGSVEQKLAALLRGVEPAVARLAAIRTACDVQVNVVFEGWGGDPQCGGIHVDVDIVQRLAALGAELDFDLYAFGPKMLED